MGRQPKQGLDERQRLIALMAACGREDRQIATELDCPLSSVKRARRSPLFTVMVREVQRELVREGVKTVAEKLLADGTRNVDFLVKLRDGDEDLMHECDVDAMKLRLQAAGMLFDRQVPRRHESDHTETVRFIVERDDRRVIEAACEEVGAPMPALEDLRPSGLPTLSATLTMRDLDEVVEEYRAREEAEREEAL